MKGIKLEARITVRTIVRWEQFTGRGYGEFSVDSAEDVHVLIYCSALCSNSIDFTYDEFLSLLESGRWAGEIGKKIERSQRVMAQFNAHDVDNGGGDSSGVKFSDSVFRLISSGLPPEYVLDRMALCDMVLHLKALDADRREMMEGDRLWTYLGVLPHVDGRKLRDPMALYPFPWEESERDRAAMDAIESGEDMFRAFMNGDLN